MSPTGRKDTGLQDPAQLLNGLSVDGLFPDADLESIVFRRVVAARDHDAAVDRQLKEGEIDHGDGQMPNIDHVHAARQQSLDQGIEQARRAEPPISADRNGAYAPIFDIGAVGPPDLLCNRFRQFLADDAAEIVFAKESHAVPQSYVPAVRP